MNFLNESIKPLSIILLKPSLSLSVKPAFPNDDLVVLFVFGFAKSISNQYAKYNILVNNVLPGRIITNRIIELAEKKAKETGKPIEMVLDSMGNDLPIGRLGKPDEFASMVTFLCSEKASYITGNSINIDGGLIKSIF